MHIPIVLCVIFSLICPFVGMWNINSQYIYVYLEVILFFIMISSDHPRISLEVLKKSLYWNKTNIGLVNIPS